MVGPGAHRRDADTSSSAQNRRQRPSKLVSQAADVCSEKKIVASWQRCRDRADSCPVLAGALAQWATRSQWRSSPSGDRPRSRRLAAGRGPVVKRVGLAAIVPVQVMPAEKALTAPR